MPRRKARKVAHSPTGRGRVGSSQETGGSSLRGRNLAERGENSLVTGCPMVYHFQHTIRGCNFEEF
jgi:hypothetical protein